MMQEHVTTEIPVSSIEIGVFSPRKTFNAAYVSELAESIELRGLLKPLTVRPDPSQASVRSGKFPDWHENATEKTHLGGRASG
jgi:ParB-like chromosome segregation protein Spo0J